MKRVLALLLTLVMALSLLPLAAFAEEPEEAIPTEEAALIEAPAEDAESAEEEPAPEGTPAEEAEPASEEEPAEEAEPSDTEEAEEAEEPAEELPAGEEAPIEEEGVFVNPIYAGVISEEDILAAVQPKARLFAAGSTLFATYGAEEPEKVSDIAAAGVYMRGELQKHTAEIRFSVDMNEAMPLSELSATLWRVVKQHTGVSTEGDYISYQLGGYETKRATVTTTDPATGTTTYSYTVTITPLYFSTAAQETELTAAINSFYTQYGLKSAFLSDFEKIEILYDYFCANIRFDNTAAHAADDYYPKYSAYAAMTEHLAVCQGFSALFYRLCLELGIDARVIPSDSMHHAWNIVHVDAAYYYIDLTWDSQHYQAGRDRRYFLRGKTAWLAGGHTLGDELRGTPALADYFIPNTDCVTAPTITLSREAVSFASAAAGSVSVTASLGGRLPGSWTIDCRAEKDAVCAVERGELRENRFSFTVSPRGLGSTKVILSVINSYTKKICATAELPVVVEGAGIVLEPSAVRLDLSQGKTKTIGFSIVGNVPANATISLVNGAPFADIAFGAFTGLSAPLTGLSAPLTVTAAGSGSGEVLFRLINADTGAILAEQTLSIMAYTAALGGTVTQNTALPANAYYWLSDDLTVAPGVTLSFGSGSALVGDGKSVTVQGALEAADCDIKDVTILAQGSDAAPARITLRGGSFENGALLPESGSDHAALSLSGVFFRGLKEDIVLSENSAESSVSQCVFTRGCGISTACPQLSVQNCAFFDNCGLSDIRYFGGRCIVSGNSFYDLGVGIRAVNGSIDVSGNYWFTSSLDEVRERFSGNVECKSVLKTAASAAPHNDPANTGTHSIRFNAASAGSCTEPSCPEHWRCEYCGRIFSDATGANELPASGILVPAAGHAPEYVPYKAMVCPENGNIEYWHCTRCGKCFTDAACTQEIDPADVVIAAQHSYDSHGVCSCGAVTAENTAAGSCGEAARWVLTKSGELILYGTGATADYAPGAAPWQTYSGRIFSVTVEDGITAIGDNALRSLGITALSLPESVERLGAAALMGCTALANIDLPDGIVLGEGALSGTGVRALFLFSDALRLGETVSLNIAAFPQLSLGAYLASASATGVRWSSSDPSVAAVDGTGAVTFLLPGGTATVTATAVGDESLSASVTFISHCEDNDMLLRAAITDSAVPVGALTAVTISDAAKALPAESLDWEIISGTEYAEMTAPGVFRATREGGTVTVEAALRSDTFRRSASVSFTTVPAALETVTLFCGDMPISEILSDFSEPGRQLTYNVRPVAAEGSAIVKYKTATSDSGIASVKALKDGSYNIVLNAKNTGACTVTFTPYIKNGKKELAQTPAVIRVDIADYTPRMDSSVTLNSYLLAPVKLPVAASYENAVQEGSVAVYETDKKGNRASLSDRFAAKLENGVLSLSALGTVSGTIKLRLAFLTERGSCDLPLSVKVKNEYPKLSAAVRGKLDLFDGLGTVAADVSAANGAAITALRAEIKGYTVLSFTDGVLTLARDLAIAKPASSGKLYAALEGYRGETSVSLKLSTTAKPSLSLSVSSAALSLEKGGDFSFFVYDKNAKANLDLRSGYTVTAPEGYAVRIGEQGEVIVTPTAPLTVGKKSLSFYVSGNTWTIAPVKLSFSLKVESTLPTLKLKSSTLTLNSLYPAYTAETALTVSQSNVPVTVSFAPQKPEGEKLAVVYENGVVTARVLDPTVLKGSYTFIGTAMQGETRLKDVKLTVKVVSSVSSVSLKASGKLDVTVPESRISYTLTLSNLPGAPAVESAELLNAATMLPSEDFLVSIGEPNGGKPTVNVTLRPQRSYALTNYNLILRCALSGGIVVESKKFTVKPAQSALKLQSVAAKTVYQSQGKSYTLAYIIPIKSPAGASIGSIALGSLNSAFRKNLADAASTISWTITPNGQTAIVYVTVHDTSRLVRGKSYTLPLVIAPQGAATASASAKINLSLKVLK